MIWASNCVKCKIDIYRGKGCMKMFCEPFFTKKKNTIHKNGAAEITWKGKNLLHLQRKSFLKKMPMMKNISKLDIIVIIQVNIEGLHKAYVKYM